MNRSGSDIPMPVVRRLPIYYRYMRELMRRNVTRISSKELSRLLGFTASQIRQDLNYFGGFGQKGYGYNVWELREHIGTILGINNSRSIIIIGAGNLGQAFANYGGFSEMGFILKAMFDVNPRLIGMSVRGVRIMDIDDLKSFVQREHMDIGVICTSREGAQSAADRLVDSGLKFIWNFAPTDLAVPKDVMVENIYLCESLMVLSYLMNERDDLQNVENI